MLVVSPPNLTVSSTVQLQPGMYLPADDRHPSPPMTLVDRQRLRELVSRSYRQSLRLC